MRDRDLSGFTGWDDQRMGWLSAMAMAIFVVLGVRLFYLQVVRGPEMARRAERNRTHVLPLTAPRGLIYAREDERDVVLMDNAPRFSIYYSRGEEADAVRVQRELSERFPALAKTMSRRLAEARRTGKLTRLASDIPRTAALALMERRLFLPGVNVLAEPQRLSRWGSLAGHALGVADFASEEDLKNNPDLRMGQRMGRSGVERRHDAVLRGADGGLQLETDAGGRHVRVIRRIPSVPGADVYLTLDRRLQSAAEAGLAHTPTGRGAAVALDPRTGAVLALASAPGFDPSGDLAPHLRDERLPLYNRALQGVYPPGSIFKIVTALCALQDAGWAIRTRAVCGGSFPYGDRAFGCWKKHGRLDFAGAVAWSCNVYFYPMGLAAGIASLETRARELGFGAPTGIDLFGENAGLMPGPAWKRRSQKRPWVGGDTLNTCIGQGAVGATPLQAALLMATVANRGTVWRPYMVRQAVSPRGRVLFHRDPDVRDRVSLSAATWDVLQKSLEGVVVAGSGRGVHRADLVIGAKTGTAQNPHGEDHAWFGAYAGHPHEPASLALAVFVENGGQGSVAAGPVARAMIDAYFPADRSVP